MEEISIGPETFNDLVHIDLNEEEEHSAQVLKDVLKVLRLGGSQEDEDEIKFYTSKLGQAIDHFLLSFAGSVSEAGEQWVHHPEDLESIESGSRSENSDRLLAQ